MSAELLTRHRATLPSWSMLYYDQPIEIVRGQGRHVYDAAGARYLDFFAGILTNAVGYDIPEISDAVRAQIDTGVVHTSTLYLIRKQVELAERIAEVSGIRDAKVFFTSSGSEANETALLLATQYRRSGHVLAMHNSYHGRTFGTVGVSGTPGWSPSALNPVQVSYVHGSDPLRGPFRHLGAEEYVQACVEDLRAVIETTPGDIACLIAEPIQGVGGFTMPPDGLFAAMKEVLDGYGILFISDEVQTGWGRTGEHFWGAQAHGIELDVITFAKGIGNGYPIGGVIAPADVMDCLSAHSISTFGGNPLSTTAAHATLQYILDHDLQANAAKVGAHLIDGLRAAQQRLPTIGDVRGKGLMIGIDLIAPDTGGPSPDAAAAVQEHTKQAGLLVGRGGPGLNVIRLAPPMTLTHDEAEEGLQMLTAAIATV